MSWIHGTATNYKTLSQALTAAVVANSLQSVDSIAAGGSGYVVGDVLTLSGGTSTIATQVEVLTLSGSAVATVRIVNAGVYTAAPSDPVSTTGGSGSSCTLNCTFADNGWTVDRDVTYDADSNREVVMHGEGAGSDAFYVGWRTFHSVANGYYNWELHGFTGYNGALDFDEQPGVSPGFFDGVTNALKAGCYMLGSNSSIEYWFAITSYRIVMVWKVGSAYFNGYLGIGNRFATESEYPYPIYVAGHTSSPSEKYTQSKLTSGLVDPWRSTANDGALAGPAFLMGTDNQWYAVYNAQTSASSKTPTTDRIVLPCAIPGGVTDAGVSPEDKFMSAEQDFAEFVPQTILTGDPQAHLHPTEGATEDYYVLFPTVVVFTVPTWAMMVELEGVYWVNAFGGLTSEDRIIFSGEAYRVFQNCNRTDTYAYLAIREA